MADQSVAARSPTANQNVANNGSKLLCNWSQEKWTKTAAYVATVTGMVTVVIITIFLAQLSMVKKDLIVRENSASTIFDNKKSSHFFIIMASTAGITTSKITDSQYDYVVGYFVTLMILQVAFTILAIYIVVGVTKKNLKHIIQGITLKLCLLVLNVLFFLSQLIVLASCGYESNIWGRLFMIVGDGIFIMIVNNYFMCEKEALAASNLNDQLPNMLLGLMKRSFPIKIPYLMKK